MNKITIRANEIRQIFPLFKKLAKFRFNEKGIHQCETDEEYQKCPICKIWGILGGKKFSIPTLTRLAVRDAYLDPKSITSEMKRNLDLEWTEVKFETAIDRVKGTALHGSLRQIERVPAGAEFKACEIVYNVFEEEDKSLLKKVFEAMELLEQDYLGGMGSRGYGKIAFKDIEVYWNKREDYESGNVELTPERKINGDLNSPVKVVKNFEEVKKKLSQQ